ncbi:MAG: carbonic anhydrase [Solirubrobacterales bacterium]
MSATDRLLKRNADRTEDLSEKALTISPDLHALVLTCADHRVDPAYVLGVDLGEAVVLRNPGGRVTPSFIQNLAILAVVAAVEGLDPGFELIVMHHTDCGMSRLDGGEHAGLLAHYFGVEEEEIPVKHVSDPYKSVQADLEVLRSNPLIPPTLIASGIVYNIESGQAKMVCPPAPLGDAA